MLILYVFMVIFLMFSLTIINCVLLTQIFQTQHLFRLIIYFLYIHLKMDVCICITCICERDWGRCTNCFLSLHIVLSNYEAYLQGYICTFSIKWPALVLLFTFLCWHSHTLDTFTLCPWWEIPIRAETLSFASFY